LLIKQLPPSVADAGCVTKGRLKLLSKRLLSAEVNRF
jgi:hypothetical protein